MGASWPTGSNSFHASELTDFALLSVNRGAPYERRGEACREQNSNFALCLLWWQTVVRASTFEVEGYISGILNDIQKLSLISSNTLRGKSPTSRRRAQSLGLLGEDVPTDMYLQYAEVDWADKYGNYLNCNGGSKSSRRQTLWPDYKPILDSETHSNGLVMKAQSLGPSEFQGANSRFVPLSSGFQHQQYVPVPEVDREAAGRRSSEEHYAQPFLGGQANTRPPGEGSPGSKSRENSLKRRLLRSVFPSSSASNKVGISQQIIKVCSPGPSECGVFVPCLPAAKLRSEG